MHSGYYKDSNGNCLGYWQASEVPADTDILTYIESNNPPPLYVSPQEAAEKLAAPPAPTLAQLQAQLTAIQAQITALS